MPRVPTYDGQQVAAAPVPGARLSSTPEAYGSGIGRGLQQVSQAAAEIYRAERQKADQIAVLDMDRQLSEFETAALYDPTNGALNKRGRDAFGLPEQVRNEFDKVAAKLEQSAGSDEQRLALARMIASRRADIDRTVQRHVGAEIRRYDDQTTESYITNARNAAAFNYSDAQRVALEIDRQRAAYVDYAARNGLPSEWVKEKVAGATSGTHLAVLDRMLATDQDQQAHAYHERIKGDLIGEDAAKADKMLEAGTLRGESQRRADAILAATTDRAEAMDQAKAIVDPKLRDATADRVQTMLSQLKQAEGERREKAFLEAANAIENGGDLGSITPAMRLVLTPGQIQSLEQRARQVARGIEPANNDRAWLAFLGKSDRELAKLSQADLMEMRGLLDDAHYERAAAMWKAARDAADGNPDAAARLTSTLTFNDVVENTLRQAGLIDPTDSKSQLGTRERKLYTAFELAAARELQRFELTELGGKRKATQEEMQKLVDGMAMKRVRIAEWGRDPELPAVLVEDDDRAAAYVPLSKVPKPDQAAIENRIRGAGRRVTSSKVQRAYAQYLLGDRAAFERVIAE